MNVQDFSGRYEVRRLQEKDIAGIHELCLGNPAYYEHMKSPVSADSIREDMKALPPGIEAKDKYYAGYFQGDELVAVADLILSYPDRQTAWIGFFMMNQKQQGRGIGSGIVADLLKYIKSAGFMYAGLGYVKGNDQSGNFWRKNGFVPTGTERENGDYTVVVMRREL